MKRRGGIASQNFHNATIIFNIFTYFITIIVIMILTITN